MSKSLNIMSICSIVIGLMTASGLIGFILLINGIQMKRNHKKGLSSEKQVKQNLIVYGLFNLVFVFVLIASFSSPYPAQTFLGSLIGFLIFGMPFIAGIRYLNKCLETRLQDVEEHY